MTICWDGEKRVETEKKRLEKRERTRSADPSSNEPTSLMRYGDRVGGGSGRYGGGTWSPFTTACLLSVDDPTKGASPFKPSVKKKRLWVYAPRV